MNINDSDFKKKTSFFLAGWSGLIKIEYGFYRSDLIWRVKNTNHIFQIDLRTIIEHHNYDYDAHFKLVLNKFREDFISWVNEGLNEKWMENYFHQFKNLIIY